MFGILSSGFWAFSLHTCLPPRSCTFRSKEASAKRCNSIWWKQGWTIAHTLQFDHLRQSHDSCACDPQRSSNGPHSQQTRGQPAYPEAKQILSDKRAHKRLRLYPGALHSSVLTLTFFGSKKRFSRVDSHVQPYFKKEPILYSYNVFTPWIKTPSYDQQNAKTDNVRYNNIQEQKRLLFR